MKTLTFLLLFPFAILAQEKPAATKATSTDCPTWKNKQQVSKADYFESLRHPKSKAQPVTTVAKPEKPVKKAAEPKPEKAYVPSFASSEDKTEKKLTEKPAEKVKEETKPVAEKEAKPAGTAKPKAEKKPAKKKTADYSSGKVRTSKKDASDCPAFK